MTTAQLHEFVLRDYSTVDGGGHAVLHVPTCPGVHFSSPSPQEEAHLMSTMDTAYQGEEYTFTAQGPAHAEQRYRAQWSTAVDIRRHRCLTEQQAFVDRLPTVGDLAAQRGISVSAAQDLLDDIEDANPALPGVRTPHVRDGSAVLTPEIAAHLGVTSAAESVEITSLADAIAYTRRTAATLTSLQASSESSSANLTATAAAQRIGAGQCDSVIAALRTLGVEGTHLAAMETAGEQLHATATAHDTAATELVAAAEAAAAAGREFTAAATAFDGQTGLAEQVQAAAAGGNRAGHRSFYES